MADKMRRVYSRLNRTGGGIMKKYQVNRGCRGCGTCIYECPVGAISINSGTGARIDPEKCTGCGLCIKNCASEAISMIEISAVDGTVK